jgi:hypothetical protein
VRLGALADAVGLGLRCFGHAALPSIRRICRSYNKVFIVLCQIAGTTKKLREVRSFSLYIRATIGWQAVVDLG